MILCDMSQEPDEPFYFVWTYLVVIPAKSDRVKLRSRKGIKTGAPSRYPGKHALFWRSVFLSRINYRKSLRHHLSRQVSDGHVASLVARAIRNAIRANRFAIETPIFIARQADSHESLEFPIRANHATKVASVLRIVILARA